MLDLATRLRTFYASSPQNIHRIETTEIYHSDMSQTYHLWPEPYEGTITLEDSSVVSVSPVNMETKLASSEVHLDQNFDIGIDTTDINDILRSELDRIAIDTKEKMRVVHREYLSDDLTTPEVVAKLQGEGISYKKGSATISAVSPRLNITRTGSVYSSKNIQPLRGFL